VHKNSNDYDTKSPGDVSRREPDIKPSYFGVATTPGFQGQKSSRFTLFMIKRLQTMKILICEIGLKWKTNTRRKDLQTGSNNVNSESNSDDIKAAFSVPLPRFFFGMYFEVSYIMCDDAGVNGDLDNEEV
jgi:hypothetical protein